MSDNDNKARSPLLPAQHHTAQREHSQSHHKRLHRALRKRQDGQGDVVTEIVATISIIQQINVDSNGNTIGIETIQTHLTSNVLPPPALATEAPLPTAPVLPETLPSPAPAAPPPIESQTSLPVSTELITSQPLPTPSIPGDTLSPEAVLPTTNLTLSITDALTTATSSLSETTTFPSLTASLNSTALFSILKNATQTYSNSSRSSTSLSTTSSRSTTLFSLSDTTSSFSSTPSLVPATTDGLVAAGTGVAPGIAPENTADSAAGNDTDNGLPPTPVVVGGVIGSIAGAAVLIIAMLFLIRWRKRNKGMLSLSSGSAMSETRDASNQPSSGAMTERRSAGFTIPASFANLANKRFSRDTETPDTAVVPAERGFYRISGRKLPSVLQHGGDGYGGGPEIDNDTPIYRDSHAFFGGRGPPSPPLGSFNRQSTGGVPIFRPSPARTPTQEQSPFEFHSRPGVPNPPRIPDHIGRSHASQDGSHAGSHASRFTEEV